MRGRVELSSIYQIITERYKRRPSWRQGRWTGDGPKLQWPASDNLPPVYNTLLFCTTLFSQIHTTLLFAQSTPHCLMTLNRPKRSFSEFFAQFCAATRISRVNCAKMAVDRPRQPAYEIFSMECRF